MKLLVEHGADPKLATKAGDTPLHAAAGIGWAANWSVNAPVPLVDAVKYCVELGNDVNAVDNRGYTPLHGAAYLGNNDMVEFPREQGRQGRRQEQGRRFAPPIWPTAPRASASRILETRGACSKSWARPIRTTAVPINAWLRRKPTSTIAP